MKTAALILALLTITPAMFNARAGTLGDEVASNGCEWVVGSWATEDGNVSLTYSWKLDKNALSVNFKVGDREAEGMIMLKPGTKEAIYGAADNQGGMSTGKWDKFNDHPTLFTTNTKADGTEMKMAAEHIKTDDDTLTVKVYPIGSDGKPDESNSRSIVFKRKK